MKRERATCARLIKDGSERGFTLIETTIALLIMMIVMLGVASVFAFAVSNNSNGADRAQTLAVAQQTLETLRNAQYSSTATDPLLKAGTITQTVYRGQGSNTGRQYRIVSDITDNLSQTLKTITVSVTPITAGPKWASASSWATVTIITQRSKTN
ncbi:MAG TPA: prepilin-type N-terminal cleavage/methylation domain-containing protein [Pyrinomonadaceae bacterium]|nr:prepilin-type N-terminal cleavage/methylation domain-containing protein [Pyrinomonadaceae bacterium]